MRMPLFFVKILPLGEKFTSLETGYRTGSPDVRTVVLVLGRISILNI